MKKIYFIITLLSLLVFSVSQGSCPKDLADHLYKALKTQIAWVDINSNGLMMTIRYYPCFSSRTEIDSLLMEALIVEPDCRVLNPGVHRLEEGYCVLEGLQFVAV